MDASAPLTGRRVAVPETRQLDVLAGLLERRGAQVLRCPLVGIHDTTDVEHVHCWLDSCIRAPFDDLVLLTGEGLRRLVGFAERWGWREDFIASIARSRTVVRGPKPARALRELGLNADVHAQDPTTAGIIEVLEQQSLMERRIGVQLYGDEDNAPLRACLDLAGAHPLYVKPYRYADEAEDTAVDGLIAAVLAGEVDALLLTSSPQVSRLARRLAAQGQQAAWQAALGAGGCLVAAVGPVVAQACRERDWPVDLMPTQSYFMKPLVQALVERWA